MNSKSVIFASLWLSTCLCAKPPNIVILLADDMGWNDVGFHGSEVPTPNIDALAYSGIVFKRHYAQPCCTPSRAALLTGQYPIRYGLNGKPLPSNSKDALPDTIQLMPEVLKTLGYQTHLVGKWHLGYSTWSHMPTRRGFDSFFGYLNGFLSYYDGVHYEPNSMGLDFRSNETESWPTVYAKYLPEFLSEQANTIVKNHNALHKDAPLFMLLSTNAPHAGGNRPFRDDPPPKRSNGTEFIKNTGRRVLADVMRYVDDTLGNLTTTLKSEGMLENTVIIFLSDNGGPAIDPKWGYDNSASNFPLRGVKMSAFEGGVRVPAILWKSGLNSSKKIYDNLFHITDWFPTLNTAAGGGKLEGLDGVDQWEALTGSTASPPREELLVEIIDNGILEGYMKGDFKFVKSYNTSGDLAFADDYFSPPVADEIAYQLENVQASSVARALGMNLDAESINNLRRDLMLNQSCSEEDQRNVADCSELGCLFNLRTDPSECFDISSQYPDIVRELIGKVKNYKDVLVTLPVSQINVANSRNYFAPSTGCNLSAFSSLALALPLLSFLLYLSSTAVKY